MAFTIEADNCTVCSACADECPSGAISMAKSGANYVIDAEKCVDCGACESACPSGAIHAGT